MKFFQYGGVPVPVQLGSSSAKIQHIHRVENERADVSVKGVPIIVQLAGDLRGEELEFVFSHQHAWTISLISNSGGNFDNCI